ncbi:MAG: hypothetical protein IJM87_07475 [Ruminococcus sp.]|nr:hypothetical protein [Ruminococcus sp.]
MAEYKTAAEKLDAELKAAKKLSLKGQAVSSAVVQALKDFCAQNSEFERAVLDGDTVDKCIESTIKNVGNSIPDLEVYNKAAGFYHKGATVRMTPTIDLGDEGFSNDGKIELGLDDLLDF